MEDERQREEGGRFGVKKGGELRDRKKWKESNNTSEDIQTNSKLNIMNIYLYAKLGSFPDPFKFIFVFS